MNPKSINAIDWHEDNLVLLDQRKLPETEVYIRYGKAADVAQAISSMVVRGAPAIGITAAYAVVLSILSHQQEKDKIQWHAKIEKDFESLSKSRPTAVNLAWALSQMKSIFNQYQYSDRHQLAAHLKRVALKIHQEDIRANLAMGQFGAELIQPNSQVLTHCNAGALATGGHGTALGVIRTAFAQGKLDKVYADETRPWFQGSRLTAWELLRDNISVTLLADGANGYLMQQGKISWLIVGADRVAANGDVANKIGTYAAAVNAKYHRVKVMIVAPSSTIDLNSAQGSDIPIEMRDSSELQAYANKQIAAAQSEFWNPVFDITPASLVDFLVTEKGVISEPNAASIAILMRK